MAVVALSSALLASPVGATGPGFDDLASTASVAPAAAAAATYEVAGFDVRRDTPIWTNRADGAMSLTAAWGVCTAMARVVGEYAVGRRRLPAGLSLRDYSRRPASPSAAADSGLDSGGNVPGPRMSRYRPFALWTEIVAAQDGDLFRNLGRSLGLGRGDGQARYRALRDAVAAGRPVLLVVDCTRAGQVFHGLLAYRVDETADEARIWVYDCNCVYVHSAASLPPGLTPAERRRALLPAGLEDADRARYQAFVATDEGRAWAAGLVDEPTATSLVFDRRTGRFALSRAYRALQGGRLADAYFERSADADDVVLDVEDRFGR